MHQPVFHISALQLKALLSSNAKIQLIDVRTREEHAERNIGGVNIPLNELPQALDQLDPGLPVIAYCQVGGRSMRALEFLIHHGFTDVKSLDGGVLAYF